MDWSVSAGILGRSFVATMMAIATLSGGVVISAKIKASAFTTGHFIGTRAPQPLSCAIATADDSPGERVLKAISDIGNIEFIFGVSTARGAKPSARLWLVPQAIRRLHERLPVSRGHAKPGTGLFDHPRRKIAGRRRQKDWTAPAKIAENFRRNGELSRIVFEQRDENVGRPED